MNNSNKTKTTVEPELENARVGYQTTIEFVNNLNSVIWSIFNTMLVAHSIVVAGLILVLSSQFSNTTFSTVLSVIGLILCLVWFLTVKRHRDYRTFYMMSAREIEEQYLGKTVKTLLRGGEFASGKPIILKINGEKYVSRLSFWSRLARSQSTSNLIIVVFAAIYIAIFFIK